MLARRAAPTSDHAYDCPVRKRRSEQPRRPRPPFTRTVGRPSFEDLVEQALADIPEPFARHLESVAIVIDDEPTRAQLRENGLRPDQTLYGLYEGVPLVEYAADWAAMPNKITLFRLPLEEDFPDPDELAEEVTRTVVHELAHHLGIDDRRLHELGWE
jgi:predicted Zn-dependent protease with MMP-like domain